MPSKPIKKSTKRKSVIKKEKELKYEEEPNTAIPINTPTDSTSADSTPTDSTPTDSTPNETIEVDETVANHYESRLDGILTNLKVLTDTIKLLNNEIKDVKKDLSKELKKLDKSKKKKKSSLNRPPSGFAKPTKLTDELCKFMNIEKGTMKARTEVTKFFCDYFKEHDLQDPTYRRNIIPNEPIKKILNLTKDDQVSYFNLQT